MSHQTLLQYPSRLGCSTFPAPTRATISFNPGCYRTFSNETISLALLNTVFMPYRDEDISSAIINAIHRAFAPGHRSLQSFEKWSERTNCSLETLEKAWQWGR